MSMTIRSDGVFCREIFPSDWSHIEALFGSRGACGGCWCMHWRVERGGKMWEGCKGEPNRKAFRKLVKSGRAHGIIALHENKPVGWCSYGRRSEFPRVHRMKAYARNVTNDLWAINCFFLAKGYRGIGLSEQLCSAAVAAIAKQGGRRVEAYPVTLTRAGYRLPPAFSFTGPEITFQRLGFKEIQRLSPNRPLYQLELF